MPASSSALSPVSGSSPTMSFSASAPSSFPSLASMASPSLAPPSSSFSSSSSSSLSPQPTSPTSSSAQPPTGRSSMSYSQKQRNKLEDFFLLSAALSREEEATQISRLSNDIGLTKDQIRGWLRNRRKRGSYKGKTYHRVEHVLVLEWIYNHHSKYPSRRLKKKLSFELGMSYSQIKIWFQSRRQRGKPVILTRDIVEDPFSDKQWSQVMERVQRMIAKEIEEEGSPSSGVPPANIAPAPFAPTHGPIGVPSTTSDIKPPGGATVFQAPTPQASAPASAASSVAPLPSISQIFPALSPVNDIFYFAQQDQQQQQQQPHTPHFPNTPHHSLLPQLQQQSSPSYSQSQTVLKSKPSNNNQSQGRPSQSQFQFQFQFQPQSRAPPQVASSQSCPSQAQGSSQQSQFQFQFQPQSQSQSHSPSQSPALVPLNFSLSSTKPLQFPGPQTFPSSQLPPLHLNSFLFGNDSPATQQQSAKTTQLPALSFFLTNANNNKGAFPQ